MQRTMKLTQLHTAQEPGDQSYWLAQPVQARIDAVEALRLQRHTGCLAVEFRVQKVCRITRLKRD